MAKHLALDIAKWFLTYNRIATDHEGAEYISNLKLQKLLYYAQGLFLARTSSPLFSDKIVAWQHGPVVEAVYHQFKSNGANGIVFDEDFDFTKFTDEENTLLTEVYNQYAQYSAWKLRDMTHSEPPWQETEQNAEISLEIMKSYFEQEFICRQSQNSMFPKQKITAEKP